MFNFVSLLLVLSLVAVLGSFPDSITKCHKNDNSCFTKTTQEVLNKLYDGTADLNLIRFDPLLVKSLVLDKNPSSPVNIELKFKNLNIVGLKMSKVNYVKGLNFDERSTFQAVVPKLVLHGEYFADGRVLILPITGKGESEITCTNILLDYSFDMKPVEINGKVHGQIEHVKLEFNPEQVQFNFKGLFNGDKALGDNMNKFLNENSKEIYGELGPSFAKGLGAFSKELINNVLRKHPYDFLFPKAD